VYVRWRASSGLRQSRVRTACHAATRRLEASGMISGPHDEPGSSCLIPMALGIWLGVDRRSGRTGRACIHGSWERVGCIVAMY
jgi:hypothetical protein